MNNKVIGNEKNIIIAKNYLDEKEIKGLNNLVNLFLDIAENALKVFHYDILDGNGKISHKQAVQKATNEYEKYKVIQDKNYISDFDKLVKETEQLEK